jgi:hypothetical protein
MNYSTIGKITICVLIFAVLGILSEKGYETVDNYKFQFAYFSGEISGALMLLVVVLMNDDENPKTKPNKK